METGSPPRHPVPVHTGFTMEQAHAHYNATMAEVQPASAPMSEFQRALQQHRLAECQIDGECASKEAVVAMAAANPNFVAEQQALYEYDALRAQATARQEAAAAGAQLQAIADENNASCASYAPS